MPTCSNRLCAAAMALACLASPAFGQAAVQAETPAVASRALSIDDILSMESFGTTCIVPDASIHPRSPCQRPDLAAIS